MTLSPAESAVCVDRGHIPALDALRGVAILLVLWYHFSSYGYGLIPSFLLVDPLYFHVGRAAWIGVDLFGSQLLRQLVFLIVATAVCAGVAVVSWHLYERQFLNSRLRFPTGPHSMPVARVAVGAEP